MITSHKLPEYMQVFEGDLYRNDVAPSVVVRKDYVKHFRSIETVSQLKATLRAGEFAWPGCYQLFLITSDGAALSFAAARSEFRSLAWSIRNKCDDGWRVIGCEVNYEDTDLTCAHTGKPIPAAYGE